MNQVKGRDGMVSSNRNRRRPLSSGEVEGVAWQGARTVFLQKNPQGFGFTLRHFIVYPPEASLQGYKVEENGNSSGAVSAGHSREGRSPLEPMDTIFVKSVKENGPAHQAGLCTGDRLVSVNGLTVLGKTYSQVIALIQNSEDVLELTIMPKDEDVFQLAYSHDAYLKGNEPYPEEAHTPPQPPSFLSPLNKPDVRACEPSQILHTLPDNWQCRPQNTTFPVDNQPLAASTPNSGWLGGPEDPSRHFAISSGHRGGSATLSALDFHFANHNAAIASATLPPPRRSRLPVSSRAHTDALCHQALSDWYYSQTEAAERISPRHRSISQDRLLELGLALGPSPLEHRRRETLMHHHQAAAVSHDSLWLSGYGGVAQTGGRKCSEKLLAAYAEYEHNYERSVETLAQASALVLPRHKQKPQQHNNHSTKFNKKQEGYESTEGLQHQTSVTLPTTISSGGQSTLADPHTRQIQEEELVGYRSYSPSFSRKASHLLRQAHSFKEPSYSGPHLNWSPGSRSTPSDSKGLTAPRPRSTPPVPASEEEKTQLGEDRKAKTPVTHNQEVVLRKKSPNQRPSVSALRQSHFSTLVDSPEPPGLTPQETPCPVSTESKRGAGSRLAQHAIDSLSAIPFIDEPISPSLDLQACYVPACSVVSSSQNFRNEGSLISASVSPILSSVISFVRLQCQDCRSIKSRRSSYLLAITTERSKSCDEGLNNFREEGRVLTKLPKRVKSFFTDGSLETLRAQEEARVKRHSTSELGTITFSDVRKEGWLHYKQILTEKGKKVGGGIRPWKRVFSVLRSSLLFLYKDKREAVLHGAGAGPTQDENPPVSIRGCLIDIAYSETKRKHTLRLTTQDFCEYLLQAEDRDDMLSWIRTIRENSKTDNEEIGSSRKALINKKLNDYRKQSLTGNKPDTSPKLHRMVSPFLLAKTDNTSANRSTRADDIKALWGINLMKKAKKMSSPKAFGIRLEDCQPALNHKFVPMIVELCCGMVEDTGLEYTGIYRVPGNNAMVSNLQEHLNKGLDFSTAEERWQDLNVISSLLKSFFRKLPEPLFTDDKYNDFIDANRIEDGEDRLKTMKKLIQDLPDHYYHTLKFLVGHLKKVADHAEKNKMEARNLALVFGPTLVRTSEDNMTDMVTHMPDRYKIVETLIQHYDWFFSDGALHKEPKAPEDKQDIQPAPNIDHLLSNIGRPGMPGETCDSTTSDSLKSKLSSSSKKDLITKDLTPKSIINAVTRKRKKCLSAYLPGSSDDEDSEHEPVKASTCRAGGGSGEGSVVKEVPKREDVSQEETWMKKENGVEDDRNHQEQEKVMARVEREKEKETKSSERETRQRTTVPKSRVLQRPHSFIYPHQQVQPTYQRHLPEFKPASHSRPDNLATGRPMVPFWISPTRAPHLYHTSGFQENQQPDWNQQVPVRYRRTRGGRTRAVSMNVDLELWRKDDKDRGWEAEKVEVIRVIEGGPGQQRRVGVPQGSIVVPVSCQQTPPHSHPVHRTPPSGWADQGSPGSSGVVMRRSGHESRDKTRARRRHTVVI